MPARFEEIKRRRDLVEFFERALLRAQEDPRPRADGRLDYEKNLPKTYLVEFHPGNDEDGQGKPSNSQSKLDLLEKYLARLGSRVGFSVRRVEDDLFILRLPRLSFVVDASNDRFTFFHSLGYSLQTDRFIERFVGGTSIFDRAWLSSTFMSEFAETVTVEGWGANFESFVEADQVESAEYVPDRVRVRLDAPGAWRRYQRLQQAGEFSHLPIDMLRVRSSDNDQVGRARISSAGKLTARGNSFLHYQQLAVSLRDAYAAEIEGLEARHQLRFAAEEHDRIALRGEPYWVTFAEPVRNFDALIGQMFAGAYPFRLLGFPERADGAFYRINAVDLHVASRLYLEATPEWFRVFLPEDGCGNSLARIVRALQFWVDDRITVPAIA